MNWFDKLSNKLATWINNGGWVSICILGAFGIIMAFCGLVLTLIDIYHECDIGTFICCIIIDIIVMSTAIFAIYAIVNLIKKNKDLFKL